MKRDFCQADRRFVARLTADIVRGRYSGDRGFSDAFRLRILRQLQRVRKGATQGAVLLEQIFGGDQPLAQWCNEKAVEFAEDLRTARRAIAGQGFGDWCRVLDCELPALLRKACLKGWLRREIKKKGAKK